MAVEEYIQYLNSRHAVVMISGKCVILNEGIDPVFRRPDISFSTVSDFKNRYSNRKIKYGKKEVSMYFPDCLVGRDGKLVRPSLF